MSIGSAPMPPAKAGPTLVTLTASGPLGSSVSADVSALGVVLAFAPSAPFAVASAIVLAFVVIVTLAVSVASAAVFLSTGALISAIGVPETFAIVATF